MKTTKLIYTIVSSDANNFVKDGWTIKQISATERGCWVLLEKGGLKMTERVRGILRRLCVALAGVICGGWICATLWLFMSQRNVAGCILVGAPYVILLTTYVIFGED